MPCSVKVWALLMKINNLGDLAGQLEYMLYIGNMTGLEWEMGAERNRLDLERRRLEVEMRRMEAVDSRGGRTE